MFSWVLHNEFNKWIWEADNNEVKKELMEEKEEKTFNNGNYGMN